MAAYAALVSIMNTMEDVTNHPRLSTSFDQKQIQSLREKADFLLGFIETYTSHGSSKDTRDLESQIASAACAAEDVIESHVVDQIHDGFSSISLLNLQKVIEEMDCVMEKVTKLKEERGSKNAQIQHSIATTAPASSGKTMVGFEEELIQLRDALTGQESSRRIISVEGMGGAGKTTLTKNVFENPLIKEHFYIRGWVTVSQDYSARHILQQLLSCQEIKETLEGYKEMDQETEDELGLKLYKSLSGRRYLIVLDDIWSVECWEKLKFFFPDYNNKSRVVVTTRLANVADVFCSSRFKINFLGEHKSWDLFCRIAFHEEVCPIELEEVGKEIVRKRKGLPLSIVVMGAFLGKLGGEKEYWENVVRDINSILTSDEDEFCLNLLSLSYTHLPGHLKPCFLYMGILQEDKEIHVSQLIKLFVAEGFLRPNKIQTLEEIAQDYLKDLVDRNLILISKSSWNGTTTSYRIHDILREVCLKQAEQEKFLHVMSVLDIPPGTDMECRRIVFHSKTSHHRGLFDALPSAELVRSLIIKGGPLPLKSRLLKVVNKVDSDPLEAVFEQVNLRYLAYKPSGDSIFMLPLSASLLWNLQTLIIRDDTARIVAPPEIWKMKQLRHLECNAIFLPNPPQQEEYALQNLQTLANVINFTFSKDVCKRIPKVEKLHMKHDVFSEKSLDVNLESLDKLQSLKCCLDKEEERGDFVVHFTFPRSIKKLSLFRCHLGWDDVNAIGMMLPHLEVLKLDSVVGTGWEVEEGAFPRLKFLRISGSELINWTADDSNFPVLEKLDLHYLPELDEIPLGIGDVPTFRYLNMWLCSFSAAVSSTNILEEQLSVGNEDMEVRVVFHFREEEISLLEKVEDSSFPKKNFTCTSIERNIRERAPALRFLFDAALRFLMSVVPRFIEAWVRNL